MNIFRSEAHVRNWASFGEGTDEGITSVPDMVRVFSGPYFKRRLDSNYVSHMFEYAQEMIKAMKAIGKTGPFWKKPKA
jgi:hypothetical protein